MPPFVRRTVRAVARAADYFPMSLLGAVVFGAALLALYFLGVRAMDWVMLVVGAVAAALVLFDTLLVGATALFLLRQFGTGAPTGQAWIEAGVEQPTSFSVPALGWWPLIAVRWEWYSHPEVLVHAEERVFGRRRERVVFPERGTYAEVVRRVVIEDVLGLARVAIHHRSMPDMRVLPAAGGLRRIPVLLSMSGGEDLPHPLGSASGDRMELRRYVPGDPARHIHWKAFGRTRKLVVRTPERALSRSDRTAAFLVAAPGDEAVAALARVAVEQQALGDDLRFGASGSDAVATTVDDARASIVRSRDARRTGAAGLRGFVETVEREGPASLVLFVSPEPGAWLDEVIRVARARPHRVRIVVAFDRVDAEDPSRVPWWRVFVHRPPRVGIARASLDAVLRALGTTRADVLVFDRPTGRLWSEGHLRAEARAA